MYASVDQADPGRTVIVAINKTGGELTAALTVAAYATDRGVDVWVLAGGAPTIAAAPPRTAAATNAFLSPMPAYSISILVPRP